MDLNPSDEQQQLIEAFGALYAKESAPDRVRAAEPLGFDQKLWDQLRETGVVAMSVDEAHGGWGASLLDLALVAEQHGRAVAPAPLIEAQVAARLLSRLDGAAAAVALECRVGGHVAGHARPHAGPERHGDARSRRRDRGRGDRPPRRRPGAGHPR